MLSASPYEPPSAGPLTSKRLASSLELATGFGIRPYGVQIPPHRNSLQRKTKAPTRGRARDQYGLTPPGLSPPSSGEGTRSSSSSRGRAEESSGTHPSPTSSSSSSSACPHPGCKQPLFPDSPTDDKLDTLSLSSSSGSSVRSFDRRRTTTLKTYLLHLLLAPPSPPVTNHNNNTYLSSSTDSDDSYFSPRTPTDGEEFGEGGRVSLGSPEVELAGGAAADVRDRASAFASALEQALGDWVGEGRADARTADRAEGRWTRSGGGGARGHPVEPVVPPARTDNKVAALSFSPRATTPSSSPPTTPSRRTSVEFGSCPLSSPPASDIAEDEAPSTPSIARKKSSAAATLSSLLSSLLSLPLLTHTSHLPQFSLPPPPPPPPARTSAPQLDPDAGECFASSLPLLRILPEPEVLRPSFPVLREAALRRWVIQREMRKKGKIAVEVPWWESARVWGRCFGREGVRVGEEVEVGCGTGSALRWEVVVG